MKFNRKTSDRKQWKENERKLQYEIIRYKALIVTSKLLKLRKQELEQQIKEAEQHQMKILQTNGTKYLIGMR